VILVCHQALPSARAGTTGPAPCQGLPPQPEPCGCSPLALQLWVQVSLVMRGGLKGLPRPGQPGPLVCRHHGLLFSAGSWLSGLLSGGTAAVLQRPQRQLFAGAKAVGAGERQGWRSWGEHCGHGRAEGSSCLLQAWDSDRDPCQHAAGEGGTAHTSSATGPFKWATNSASRATSKPSPRIRCRRQKGCLIPTSPPRCLEPAHLPEKARRSEQPGG